MLPETVKSKIVNSLKGLNPYKIVLFGSYAHGTPRKDSDIDLLVVTNEEYYPQTFDEKMKLKLRVSKALDNLRKQYPIDLIVHTKPMNRKFKELDSMFARDISREGITLYECDNQ